MSDGTIVVPKGVSVDFFNTHAFNFKNERRYVFKSAIWLLRNKFPCIVDIVGKGPSLDNLTANDLKDSVVCFAINEAAIKVSELVNTGTLFFATYFDPPKKIFVPNNGLLITKVAIKNCHYSSFDNIITINPREFNLLDNSLSVLIVIEIAKMLGATGFRFWGFDSVKGNFDYANCVPNDPLKSERFKIHGQLIMRQLKDIPAKFM